MKLFAIFLSLLLGGCAASQSKPDTTAVSNNGAQTPSGFFVDPSFPAGDAVLAVLRRHLATQYITLNNPRITADHSHDYVRFFAGWGIDHGFESVYWRHLIFAKSKDQSWSEARVFDSSNLSPEPFEGPFELLEQKCHELGKKPTPPRTDRT